MDKFNSAFNEGIDMAMKERGLTQETLKVKYTTNQVRRVITIIILVIGIIIIIAFSISKKDPTTGKRNNRSTLQIISLVNGITLMIIALLNVYGYEKGFKTGRILKNKLFP